MRLARRGQDQRKTKSRQDHGRSLASRIVTLDRQLLVVDIKLHAGEDRTYADLYAPPKCRSSSLLGVVAAGRDIAPRGPHKWASLG